MFLCISVSLNVVTPWSLNAGKPGLHQNSHFCKQSQCTVPSENLAFVINRQMSDQKEIIPEYELGMNLNINCTAGG